ncbi:UNVERIFIED_CONTAM: hypothetical protein Sindi_1676500 [Sesamum indicum]
MEIMHEAHYAPYAMHPDSTKMYRDLIPYYWWPTMTKNVAEFVAKYLTCQQVKVEHQAPASKLHPLSIPEWKWEKITMDFVIGLPLSDRDPRFTSHFWESLQMALGTKLHRCTAFHPQINGHFHSTIGMAPYEALYGRKCRSPICWDIEGLRQLEVPELVQETVDQIKTDNKVFEGSTRSTEELR